MAGERNPKRITVYDTTLRDGAQAEGVYFSVKDKAIYLRKMDEMGVPYVEAGWPGANPRDAEIFNQMRLAPLSQTKTVAFGSTCKVGEEAAESEILRQLLASGAEVITIFGKAWDLHVTEVLKTTRKENLRLIGESVNFLVQAGRTVFFDAEHFFDGWKDHAAYAVACVQAAQEAGASALILCDTNGGALPEEIKSGVRLVKEFWDTEIGIHAHNDGGLAVANTLAAVEAGARQIQGTWNGLGERCGNANLNTIVPWLQIKLGWELFPDEFMPQITHLARFVAELVNTTFDERQPYVGKSAFAHKAGMHVDAVIKNKRTFEHVDPLTVGNERRFLISDQSGRANIWKRMQRFDPTMAKDDKRIKKVIAQIKELESQGFQFEIAEGSLDLLILRQLREFTEPFKILDYHVLIDPLRGESDSVAVVKIQVEDEIVHVASDGNGPVNALDLALRQALKAFFPQLEECKLVDYKVRVLDESGGTEAAVRVVVETSTPQETWGTIGVSSNILKASAQALVDGLYMAIMKTGKDGETEAD
ncbi:MAG: citramalate synthase [Peptococcaceae bacterium]|jgi:2-isopropylmalate synthase|nr:citramalate synthase [Peptococcaceae bacterium]